MSACVCMCVCVRERKSVCVNERETACACVHMCVCVCVSVCVCMRVCEREWVTREGMGGAHACERASGDSRVRLGRSNRCNSSYRRRRRCADGRGDSSGGCTEGQSLDVHASDVHSACGWHGGRGGVRGGARIRRNLRNHRNLGNRRNRWGRVLRRGGGRWRRVVWGGVRRGRRGPGRAVRGRHVEGSGCGFRDPGGAPGVMKGLRCLAWWSLWCYLDRARRDFPSSRGREPPRPPTLSSGTRMPRHTAPPNPSTSLDRARLDFPSRRG